MSTKQLEANDIERIVVKETAMGLDSVPSDDDILRLIERQKYVIKDTGSKGYDLLVWTDDGYKMRVIAVADTPKQPSKAIVRGGKL